MKKKLLTERFQELAGIKPLYENLEEIGMFHDPLGYEPEDSRDIDVEDVLIKAGFRFEDGILGGIGSGGAGYYDTANDKIYGYNQSGPWNEEEFNNFYDNFEFNSNLYDSEDLKGLEISQPQLDKGIHAVGDIGYVQIHSNGDVEIYATPQLAAEDDSNFLPAFKMDASGKAIPQFSKDEMRKMLKDDMMYIL